MSQTVVVGMSGGVDSSVAALLLKEAGYRVIGLFMRNWEEKGCPSTQDYEDVVRVCDQIDIPCYAVSLAEAYWESVFLPFLEAFKRGETPNPDILCNREIKFSRFLEKALDLSADYLATGHYCQIGKEGELYTLLRGADPSKDQSYFLSAIDQCALQKSLFPIGGMTKAEVREIARKHRLSTAEKRDSTGICFIGKRPFKQFLSQYIPQKKGAFVTSEGRVVGEHDGALFYTIGQRKGLAIGGAGAAWYVVGKNMARNEVVVVQGDDHPALFCQELFATQLSWIAPLKPALPLRCSAKVRYRQPDRPCTVEEVGEGRLRVRFDAAERAVTPGQAIVFYDGPICLGGGVIADR